VPATVSSQVQAAVRAIASPSDSFLIDEAAVIRRADLAAAASSTT